MMLHAKPITLNNVLISGVEMLAGIFKAGDMCGTNAASSAYTKVRHQQNPGREKNQQETLLKSKSTDAYDNTSFGSPHNKQELVAV